jgi:hypothetical protein
MVRAQDDKSAFHREIPNKKVYKALSFGRVMAKVGVSILDADFGRLQEQVALVETRIFLHFDIMDGHFVDNISFGPSG